MRRFLIRILGVALLGWVIWMNLRLYEPPPNQPARDQIPDHATAHLSWLRLRLEQGVGIEMQKLFPEGYYFSYVLYGLSWVELGLRSDELRSEALVNARWSLKHLESADGRSAFPPDLPPDHGMFYSAWKSHLLAGITLLSGEEADRYQLQSWCDDMQSALLDSPAWPWLASYHMSVWPCDTLPGIHAMCVYDDITGEERYRPFVTKWLDAVNVSLVPQYQMISHLADPGSGEPVGPPRATSQTMILRFLYDIDPEFAMAQFTRFQETFYSRRLGVPVILEYPLDSPGKGDIDSGPLIAGVSVSASVVGMGVAQLYGDHDLSRAMSQLGDVLGFPVGEEYRRYLGGFMPIGDAFVVHATTALPWIHDSSVMTIEPHLVPAYWRWSIHFISVIVVLIPTWIWRRLHKKPDSDPLPLETLDET